MNYNLLHLSAAVEQQKQQKLLKETPSEEENEARNIEVGINLNQTCKYNSLTLKMFIVINKTIKTLNMKHSDLYF